MGTGEFKERIVKNVKVGHNFWLLPKDAPRRYSYTPKIPPMVILDDDLLDYIKDTIWWIPTQNPEQPDVADDMGLNWFGPTLITEKGAPMFHHVFSLWAQLFEKAPDPIILHRWKLEHDPQEPPDRVFKQVIYETKYDHTYMIGSLRTLAEFGQKAMTGDYFIFHGGV